MIRRRITAFLLIAVMTLMITIICMPETYVFADTSDYDGPQSSFEYKKYKDVDDYMAILNKRMNGVYNTFSTGMINSKTIPIPGLVETYTVQDGKNLKSSKFVPQGLCKAGKYMLITAYDVKKKRNSVIYAVDMDNYSLVSTLTMPNKYHAGGIAFDGENIWMTGDTSDKYKGDPFVQYMTYETFERLIQEPLCEVSEDDISGHIFIKNKPSFLECNEGVLWVGTYIGRKGTYEGYMNGYKIVGEPGNRKLNTIMYSMIAGIDSSAQGADIDGRYLYVSSSYKGAVPGVKTSFITKYDLGTLGNRASEIYVDNKEVSRIEVPKMNEEILVDGQTIHINFESGADQWRTAVVNTDRIIAVKSSVWR
ncbi:MAG: hypothetical protein IKE85_04970 [Mogibacterium sp.]|nr:hypothetical protein [Mogibacterium sp.]